MIDDKYELLIAYIKTTERLTIAFSGGIDSSFLLYAAKNALGNNNLVAITIRTPYFPERDLKDALEFCENLKVKHLVINHPVPEHIRSNPVNRCYFCKKFEFSIIINEAHKHNITQIAAGLNLDDPADYRPGISAMKELNVLFPLQAVGLRKKEIREISQKLGLKLWSKPSNACILSRIPYEQYITDETIERIQKAEAVLLNEGFVNPRVRTFNKLASIEIERNEFIKFIDNEFSLKIYNAFKKIGYNKVTLDIRGYHTGSLNEDIVNIP